MRTFVVGILSIAAAAAALTGCSQASPPQGEAEGSSLSHIIGGEEDPVDKAVVAVLVFNRDQSKGSQCTGEIVDASWVLTAAHCVTPSVLGFTPGQSFIVTAPKISTATTDDVLTPSDLIPHPKYDPQTGANDVALIKLAQPTSIKPIPFNHGGMGGLDGATVRAAGYGRTADKDTNSADAKMTAAFTIAEIQNTSFRVDSPDSAQCHGDSGGPVFATVDGQDVVVGITWRTVADDGSCLQGAWNTRVDVFTPWLDSVIDGSNDGSQDVTTA